MVSEALASSFNVKEVFRIEEVGERVMSRISMSSSPAPVVALVEIPKRHSLPPSPEKGCLYIALDSVRDPGNIGTIIRTADWFGAKGIFLSSDCADVFNPKVVQSSMGSVFRVPTYIADLTTLCRRFRLNCASPVYGTFLDGENIYESDFGSGNSGGLLVMGNESVGVSREVAAEITQRLFIPSCEGCGAESLNVAAATAVCLSEFRRKKGRE